MSQISKLLSSNLHDEKEFHVVNLDFNNRGDDGGAISSGSSDVLRCQGFRSGERQVISNGVIGLNRETVQSISDDLINANGFTVRTRINPGDIHELVNFDTMVTSLADITIASPVILQTLANDVAREKILDAMCDNRFIKEIVRHVVGPTQRLKIGSSRRFSFFDINRLVSDKLKFNLGRAEVLVVAKVIYEALLPLDVHFNSLELRSFHEIKSRVMRVEDVRSLVKEIEIRDCVGDPKSWLDKRVLPRLEKGNEVWRSVVEESLSSSLLNFRARLGSLQLFDLKFDAVMLCSRMALINRLGVKTNFSDFVIAQAATADANIQQISRWYCVCADLLNGGIFDEGLLHDQYSRGMSIDVISMAADKIVTAMESHPLVRRYAAGDFVKNISVGRRFIRDNIHYLTELTGAVNANVDVAVFNEFNVSESIFRMERNRVSSGILKSLASASSRIVVNNAQHVHDMNNLQHFDAYEAIESDVEIIRNAQGLLSIYNVELDALVIKCLLSFDLSLWYSNKDLQGSHGFAQITEWAFTIPRTSSSILHALSIVDGTFMTKDLFTAAFFFDPIDAPHIASNSSIIPDKDLFGLDFMQALSDSKHVTKLARELRGKVILPSSGEEVGTRYKLHSSKIMFVADSLQNYVLSNDAVREVTCLLASNLSAVTDAYEQASLMNNRILANELVRSATFQLINVITELGTDSFFNSLRRLILDELIRNTPGVKVSWSTVLHDINYRNASTIAAVKFVLRLLGSDDVNSLIHGYFDAAYSNDIAYHMLYAFSSSERWNAITVEKL